MITKRLQQLTLAVVGVSFVVSVPQQAQALSLACYDSLDDMEQSSDLIIRGRTLSDVDDVEELNFSQAEYQARLATGEALPLGVSVVVHDDKWQFVDGYTALPVEVLTVFKGETDKRMISVIQNDDWEATSMVKDAEYLLFLHSSLRAELAQTLYSDLYGQGKYNTDGADLTAGSVCPQDTEGVRKRYSDRIDFAVPASSEKVGLSLGREQETNELSWFRKMIVSFRQWLKAD